MRHILLLSVLLRAVSAAWLPPFVNTTKLVEGQDPPLLGSKDEFGATPDGDNKKELLQAAFKDVYRLVNNVLNHWDDDIFNRWFPKGGGDDPDDRPKVRAAFEAITKDRVSLSDVQLTNYICC